MWRVLGTPSVFRGPPVACRALSRLLLWSCVMSLRSCSDAELSFEIRLRSELAAVAAEARSFDDFLDGTCCSGNDGVHPEWDVISADVFAALERCRADLCGIRKGVFESAPGEYSGRAYD